MLKDSDPCLLPTIRGPDSRPEMMTFHPCPPARDLSESVFIRGSYVIVPV